MSCIDAAIIAEMNKQKTDNANSISTNNIKCSYGNFRSFIDCGEAKEHYYDVCINCRGALAIINQEEETVPTVRLMSKEGGIYVQGNGGKYTHITWSQTITHYTNVQGDIGTFAEATGDIYDGYTKIDNIDCICRVKQATTLNARIVGIIVDKDLFASHGDCLVRIVPGAYNIGDILVPDASGFARKATDEELVYMMTHAIPRPKITSLDTGIDGMVACFLI